MATRREAALRMRNRAGRVHPWRGPVRDVCIALGAASGLCRNAGNFRSPGRGFPGRAPRGDFARREAWTAEAEASGCWRARQSLIGDVGGLFLRSRPLRLLLTLPLVIMLWVDLLIALRSPCLSWRCAAAASVDGTSRDSLPGPRVRRDRVAESLQVACSCVDRTPRDRCGFWFRFLVYTRNARPCTSRLLWTRNQNARHR